MKNIAKKLKGKKVLSVLLALIMVLSVASPAFSSMVGLFAKAAEEPRTPFPVELAFNNLFIFEKWANNTLSSTAIYDGTPITKPTNDDETYALETDIDAGSFTLTKTDMAALELYTAFSASTTKAADNQSYYMIDVEPNTTYVFSYHVIGNTYSFTPMVFFFNSSGLYLGSDGGSVAYQTPNYNNNNNFKFTTPDDVTSIQIRFTIGDTKTNHPISGAPVGNHTAESVYATVKDIAIYKSELYDAYLDSQNLFSLEGWNNGFSTQPGLGSSGTIDVDEESGTIKFKNASTDAKNYLWSGLDIDEDGSNNTCYTMAVDPNKSYTFTYSIGDNNNLSSPVHFQPYIVQLDANGASLGFFNYETPQLTDNRFVIGEGTTKPLADGTASIQIVFAVINDLTVAGTAAECTVYDIGFYETSVFSADYETITGYPHRLPYTYIKDSGTTYGELPTPSDALIPEGMIFAGWYTGENGTGEHISADTDIHYESRTVYPKFEPDLTGDNESLIVLTPPTKTIYTVGEKFNPTGVVLQATLAYEKEITDENGNVTTEIAYNTFNITSGYRYSPKYLTSTGTQTITFEYGGRRATCNVTVNYPAEKTLTVNDAERPVKVANNEYIFVSDDYTAEVPFNAGEFNRYELAYYSDSYVKGTITFVKDGTEVSEDFFLEPTDSDEESFASYIDGFIIKDDKGTTDDTTDDEITSITQTQIKKIKFTCLDKEFGNFELKSLTTIASPVPSDSLQTYENSEYKVGIDLAFGGVVSYIQDLDDPIVARVYDNGDGKNITKVDYKTNLDEDYANMTPVGEDSTAVNLINIFDRGRYLQQSYYGTDKAPFELGSYNGDPWKYNPVQGGNIGKEASKVVDYRITDDGIYVKTRPLDWGKWSDAYPESYNTPSYMESWYVFEDEMIKTYCRFVDYSGYPSNYTDQEFPALYTIEPLNHLVYDGNKESEEDVKKNNLEAQEMHEDNLEFWGVSANYNNFHKEEGNHTDTDPSYPLDNDRYCPDNWAAFTASEADDSFGIGVYSAGITDFTVGSYPQIYETKITKNAAGEIISSEETINLNYRHAQSNDPASEDPTSYIAPVGQMTFESYKPVEYSYYITTGTADQIREDFNNISKKDAVNEIAKSKFAVPETVYMTPSATVSTIGQHYVNNVFDAENYNSVVTKAEADASMYLGLHATDAASFSVKVTNVSEGNVGGDVYLADSNGTKVADKTTALSLTATVEDHTYQVPSETNPDKTEPVTVTTGTVVSENTYGLRLNTGLAYGEKATVRWDITSYDANGEERATYTAYTVLYAPQRTVGAVAESRVSGNGNNEISSWITGATGVDHYAASPLGSFHGDEKSAGDFKKDPLVYPTTLHSENVSSETSTDYINKIETETKSTDGSELLNLDSEIYDTDALYVIQAATKDADHSRAKSYLGLLTIDKSRYTNTNQIPNLQIGYDVLRHGGAGTVVGVETYNALASYDTYYFLGGTESSFTSTSLTDVPDGTWSKYPTEVDVNDEAPIRESFVPSLAVSDEIDGQYIHALNRAEANHYFLNALTTVKRYATAGTSVRLSVTDKSGLRDAVLDGYAQNSDDPEFIDKLENAATVLGDPSATQDEINNAKKDLNNELEEIVDTFYALKYDNLFSAYEFSQHPTSMTTYPSSATVSYKDGTITVTNGTITDGEAFTNYGSSEGNYLVALKSNTEYVFEYDVTTTVKSQAFMFFYNESGAAGDAPIDRSIKVDDGAWTSLSQESNPHWGNYQETSGTKHYAIKFTTGANTTKADFRFGNKGSEAATSTFSNIKLVEASKYYEDVEYPNTELVYKEYASYGTLPTLSRTGFTFAGWNTQADGNGTTVTGANIATEHKTIYSLWEEHVYTITYDANGGNSGDDNTTPSYRYTQEIPLSNGSGFTKTGYNFVGWSTDKDATAAEFAPGSTVSKLTSVNNGSVTLYAVWQNAVKPEVAYENLFVFSEWAASDSATIASYKQAEGTISVDSEKGTITFTSLAGANDLYSNYGAGDNFYSVPVVAGEKYTLEYTVTGGNNHQAFAFFSDGTNLGTHAAYYQRPNNGTEKLDITVPAGITRLVFRFGSNTANDTVTFSNIALYHNKRSDEVGLTDWNPRLYRTTDISDGLAEPSRTGYTFNGWYVDENRNGAIDDNEGQFDANLTTLEKSYVVLSDWTEKVYTVNFSNNGASDVDAEKHNIPSIGYTGNITLPTLTCDYADFVGWSFNETVNPYASEGIYAGGTNINISAFPAEELEPDAQGTPVIKLNAVWKLKTSAVVSDTVVADFGQPVKISPYQMSDKGIVMYHVTDICQGKTSDGNKFDVTFPNGKNGKYGTFALNDDGYTITYTPTAVMQDVDTIDVRLTLYYSDTHTQTLDSTITVAPASNMLYEEDDFITYGGQTSHQGISWTKTAGSTYTAKLYDKNTGLYNDQKLIDETPQEVYGYNSQYTTSTGFSDGSYSRVIVTADNKNTTAKENMSDSATFTFKGTGFDLISACGVNTGIQVVKVKDSKGNIVDSFIIDTYLSDTSIMTASADKDVSGNAIQLLHQVPILSYRTTYKTVDGVKTEVSVPFGEYTVEVNAAYLSMAQALKYTGTVPVYYSSAPVVAGNGVEIVTNTATASSGLVKELEEMGIGDLGDNVELLWMDDNSILNGGTGASDATTTASENSLLSGQAQQYFSSSVTALANYLDGIRIYNPLDGGDPLYIESEQNASYYNIVQQLEMDSSKSNLAYIESNDPSIGLNFITQGFNFDAYNSLGGPSGEIYLRKNDAIAFKFSANHANSPANVMLGMRAVTGTPIAYTNVAGINGAEPTITSSTEMYYEIATNVNITNEGVTVIVINKGEGILAVNNVKLVNGTAESSGEGSNPVVGGTINTPVVNVPVPETGNAEDVPETDVDTENSVPETDTETDVEDNVEEDAENNVSVAFPGMPAPIASFLEMLFKLLGQLVGSLGF